MVVGVGGEFMRVRCGFWVWSEWWEYSGWWE